MAIPTNLPPGFVFNPVRDSPYHYVPSGSAAIIMIVLFGLSSLLHTGQAVYYKTWWLFPTAVLCGVMEIGGWAARLWSHSSPWLFTPFKIQICLTIIAPTPLLAGTFVIFGRIIGRLGYKYSRLSPKHYIILFCTCDIVSLVVQGVGGGLAATAVGNTTGPGPDLGAHIMLGGIGFQLFTISVFSLCAGEYVFRYIKDRPIRSEDVQFDNTSENSTVESPVLRGELTTKLKVTLGALVFSTLCLFIRAVYRTIELADGWSGRIISTQVYFNVLDGAMIVLSIWTLNIVHPGLFLAEPPSESAPKRWLDDKQDASIEVESVP